MLGWSRVSVDNLCVTNKIPATRGGACAEIQYISSAPSVLTPIRLLTTPTTSHEVYAYPGLSRDFVVLGLHRVLKGAKSRPDGASGGSPAGDHARASVCGGRGGAALAVFYTHLTLPTTYPA